MNLPYLLNLNQSKRKRIWQTGEQRCKKIREALRLHSEADMAVRQICVIVGASVGTVQSWLSKTRQAQLGWQLALQMSDEELAALIYGDEGRSYRQPDWQWIHQELKIKGVTRQLLFEEYRAQGGKCYHYSRFCDLYSNWLKRQKRSMRQVHKGGEKAFVDYSGKTVLVFDGEQSVWRQAQIFVGVLGLPTTPMRRRLGVSRWRTGWAATRGWWSFSAVFPTPSCRTTSKRL